MATPLLSIPEVNTSILSFALLNIILRHYEQASSRRILSAIDTPPSSPSDGDAHFVTAGATGLWVGREGEIAFSISGAWYFINVTPGVPYYEEVSTSLVTLDPVTATTSVFTTGGGGSALTTRDEGVLLSAATTSIDFVGSGVTATSSAGNTTVTVPGANTAFVSVTLPSSGTLSVPTLSYGSSTVIQVNCVNVTADFAGINLGLLSYTATSAAKTIKIVYINVPTNVVYLYRPGSSGIFTTMAEECYPRNGTADITFELQPANGALLTRARSMPTLVTGNTNYTNPSANYIVLTVKALNYVGAFNVSAISTGAALFQVSFDDNFLQDLYLRFNWDITIYGLPGTVTNVQFLAPAGAFTTVVGITNKTPIAGVVNYRLTFETNGGVLIAR